jgi:hypothetical protein
LREQRGGAFFLRFPFCLCPFRAAGNRTLLCERAQQEFATRMTLIVAIGISERPLIYV